MNARQAEEAGLLERYAPVLRFHPQEPYRADSPRSWPTRRSRASGAPSCATAPASSSPPRSACPACRC